MGISDMYNKIGKGVGEGISNTVAPLKSFLSSTTNYTAPTIAPKAPVVLDKNKFLGALGSNETGGIKGNPYSFYQPSGIKKYGNALGKYQVTEANLKKDAPLYLGQSLTPQQFLASTTAQDNLVYNKANHLFAQGYTPQQIADIHNKGMTHSSTPGSTTYQNPDYVNKFNANFNK